MPDYSTLPDREIDAMCAERLGWRWWSHRILLRPEEFAHATATDLPDGHNCSRVPDYSSDRNAATELEAEIKQRGMEYQYVNALISLVSPGVWTFDDLPTIILATPRQRAEAFLRATDQIPEGRG